MKRAVLLGALLHLAPVVALCQQAADTLLTLPDLLEEARDNYASLAALRLEAEARHSLAAQLGTWPDPTLAAGYQPLGVLTARGVQRSQWRLEQMIPYPGKLALRSEVAQHGARAAAHDAERLESEIRLQVKEAYYDLYRIQQHEARIRAFAAQLDAFEESASTAYAVGAGSQQAILRIQLERSRLRQRRIDLEAHRVQALETLARLCNWPALPVGARVQAPARILESLDVDSLALAAPVTRPEFRSLAAAARGAQAAVDLAAREFRPDFGLSVTYYDIGRYDGLPLGSGRDAVALGLSVKLPVQRVRLRSRLEEARVRQSQVAARQRGLEASIRAQVQAALERWQLAREAQSLLEELLVPQAEAALEASLSAYAAGGSDFASLLDAKRMLFLLEIDRVDAGARVLATQAALEHALGAELLDRH